MGDGCARCKTDDAIYFDKVISNLDLRNIGNKQIAAQKLLPILAKLGSKIEQDHWLKNLSQLLDTKEEIIREALQKITVKSLSNQEKNQKKQVRQTPGLKPVRTEMLSENLLSLLIRYPLLLDFVSSRIQPEHLIGQANQQLYKNLIFYYNIITQKNEVQEDINKIFYQDFTKWLAEEQKFVGNIIKKSRNILK